MTLMSGTAFKGNVVGFKKIIPLEGMSPGVALLVRDRESNEAKEKAASEMALPFFVALSRNRVKVSLLTAGFRKYGYFSP